MGWQPKRLTREQMEERRKQGGKLLRIGRFTQAQIARELGVSRMAVSQWAHQIEIHGMRGLSRRRAHGRTWPHMAGQPSWTKRNTRH